MTAGTDREIAGARTRDPDLPPKWFFEDERYGERAQAFDEGFTHACAMLARMLGDVEWEVRDGTETWTGDARNTLWSVLEGAGIADKETGELVRAPLSTAEGSKQAFAEALDALRRHIPEAHGIHPNPEYEIVERFAAALSKARG